MALQRVQALAVVRVPNLRRPIEGACNNFITVRVVKSHSVDNILVFFQTKQLRACFRVPYLASAVVAPGDELIT